MWNRGKKRSKLGKWLDINRLLQEDLVRVSRVNRNTISKACSSDNYIPSGSTMQKIIKALREIDPNVSASKFWDI
jgi:predicted transcriptional regulator